MKVNRHDCGYGEGMFEDKEGSWVCIEDYEKLLDKYNTALNIDLVMLSKTLEEAENKANEIDDGKSDHSLGESQGFESGANWVIERIKDKIHSA